MKNKKISELFEQLIKATTPDENEDHIDEVDRNYDERSKTNIWKQSYTEIGFYGESLYQLLRYIKDMMDKAIKEHPSISYKDFGFSSDIGYHYEDEFGLLKCEYEWFETDKEKEERLNKFQSEKEEQQNKIKQLINQYEVTFNEKFDN